MFRHYWVLFKLLINVFATIVLLIYMETFSFMAAWRQTRVRISAWCGTHPPGLHAALALLVLLVATVLAVYKPPGMTWYGWRKQHEQRTVSQP